MLIVYSTPNGEILLLQFVVEREMIEHKEKKLRQKWMVDHITSQLVYRITVQICEKFHGKRHPTQKSGSGEKRAMEKQ